MWKLSYLGAQICVSRILAVGVALIVLAFVAAVMGIDLGVARYLVLRWCTAFEPVVAVAALVAVGVEVRFLRAGAANAAQAGVSRSGHLGRLLGLAILALALVLAAELFPFGPPITDAGLVSLCTIFAPPLVLTAVGIAVLLARPASCVPAARRTVAWVLAWSILFVLLGILLSL